MNVPQRQADPRGHLMGITFVIPFHALIVYTLVTGLAKNLADLIRAQVKTRVIEEAPQ
jgi:periplasmic protein TonB